MSRGTSSASAGVQVARAAWGALLVGRPATAYGLLGGGPSESRLQTRVLRVLGARHVLQAAVTLARPTPRVAAVGAGLDGLHALTAVGYAASGGSRRRTGLADTAVAAALALGTLASSRERG